MSSLLGVRVWFLLILHYVAAATDCHLGCLCEVESFSLFDSFSLTRVDRSGVGRGHGYTTLVSLDLSNNLLSRLNSSTFFRLRYLETMDLSHNTLEELAPGCFSGLPLADVDLSSNRLQDLSLSNNLLTTVMTRDPQVLSPPNIQILNLAKNLLRAVPKLQGLPLRIMSLCYGPDSQNTSYAKI
uniref:Uncharacterized protein n=1 Tax=Oncorhynchus tshawytscha TaxID=74940 RepID=A0AAZ3P5B2_ONCTS